MIRYKDMVNKGCIIDILEKVKSIQRDRGLNNKQMAGLLGYRNRVSWAKIKSGIAPANEVFQMRAARAFPTIYLELSAKPHKLKSLIGSLVLRVKKVF